jgi:predicted N-formylglutamate amidohydrolase
MLNNPSKLITEFENARIADFRDQNDPNNDIVITCEHATNELPEDYSWTENDRTFFADDHWGYDPGALDVAMDLAKELKCVLVYSLYSRLLVDVNRNVAADTLFRTNGDNRFVDLNMNLTYEDEQERIKKYHHSYYNAIREVSVKIDPTYIFSVHSFTPLYEGQPRTLEIGVLISYSDELGKKVFDEINKKSEYNIAMNEPYDGKQGLNTVDTLLFAKYPVRRQGIEFEFRNDILLDPKRAPKVKADVLEAIKKSCNIN